MGRKMTVTRITRTDAQLLAIKLRDLARRIDAGDISYVAIYAMDHFSTVEEFVMDFDDELAARIA